MYTFTLPLSHLSFLRWSFLNENPLGTTDFVDVLTKSVYMFHTTILLDMTIIKLLVN